MATTQSSQEVKPWVRILILVLAIFTLGAISWFTVGSVIPSDPEQALLFQSSVLLIVLGSLILEKHFTKPEEALVNSLTAIITLLPVAGLAPIAVWVALMVYLAVVLLSAMSVLTLQGPRARGGHLGTFQDVAFQLSTSLGQARVLFSVVFLAVIVFFIETTSNLALSLVVFWGIYLAIWPLGLPQLFSRITIGRRKRGTLVGTLVRIDSPNIARVSLFPNQKWPQDPQVPFLVHLHDGSTQWGVPLFSESRGDGSLGTLLLASSPRPASKGTGGTVEEVIGGDGIPSVKELLELETGVHGVELVGIVREGSTFIRLRIEILPGTKVRLGQMLVVSTHGGPVYYQVIEGETSEESFGGLNYGSQIASAAQVGKLGDGNRFIRFDWLPMINAPAFRLPESQVNSESEIQGQEFCLGRIPGTSLNLTGNVVENLETHTALLGVTGSGKTEFAFDLIHHAVGQGVKVICIDLTSQYGPRLADLSPSQLSISEAVATELGQKLFDAETGAYNAGAEKRVLSEFAHLVRTDVESKLKSFFGEGQSDVGLIELLEISNTKATLWITEMYLSTLLKLAKDGELDGRKVLIVVEEAHTVMPEASFAGLGDFDSKGTIAKITQIALQGRKYGVGLLVLAQRTATVSKSVLTQCNTVISFMCIDDTSIGFLKNVFGSSVAERLPNLPRLRAVAHGQWINSEVPIAFDVPFDEEKASKTIWHAQRRSTSAVSERASMPEPEPEPEPDDMPF